jgi:hypothetical protein
MFTAQSKTIQSASNSNTYFLASSKIQALYVVHLQLHTPWKNREGWQDHKLGAAWARTTAGSALPLLQVFHQPHTIITRTKYITRATRVNCTNVRARVQAVSTWETISISDTCSALQELSYQVTACQFICPTNICFISISHAMYSRTARYCS